MALRGLARADVADGGLDALRQYAASPEYRRLQAQINSVHPI
jgi:hypothetical protein